MSDIICVTNRLLCRGDFLRRIGTIAALHPRSIILREKDMSEADYTCLAREVRAVCDSYDVPFMMHSQVQAAISLCADRIHLPMTLLRQLKAEEKSEFCMIGASVHSVEEALEAEALGASYLTAGHIFDTDCKKGLPGRGLAFLAEVCKSISIPVYAIGGISGDNIADVRKAGASGACIMSGLMQCEDVKKYLKQFEVKL